MRLGGALRETGEQVRYVRERRGPLGGEACSAEQSSPENTVAVQGTEDIDCVLRAKRACKLASTERRAD